ncbi:MAG: SDR family oxidoreductase [Candidatus Lokiarchaeota archaeon]|nr:SDR family oxidoreductase [Candidatus Lokiarchaeota archaeon]MBD3200254.1 SDR family oxidoreductase [Candidatus Lokiarchaeota archaeon]
MRVKDKVCILTGAASGIGRATAKLFFDEGAILILSDIDEKGLNETFELLGENNARVSIMKVDVREPDEVKEMIEYTINEYGRIDVLIVNAGVVRVGPVEEFPDEDYDLLINVNLKGTYYSCKYAIPHFKKQKFGSIITLASVAAHIGQVNHANYCSTKAGVLGFTKALALDMAPYNVRVNSVSPGATDTPMLQSDVAKQAKDRNVDYEVVKEEFEEEGVLGRWAEPEEIAAGILFLATNDASYMTGADLRLDGGWTTR